MKPIKVLLIDDSPVVCSLLKDCLAAAADIDVVGAATDPIAAWEQIRVLKPDVLTLDIEMPRMGGLEFLDKLMRLHPLPVIMISSQLHPGSELAQKAHDMGAVAVFNKSRFSVAGMQQRGTVELIDRIREAHQNFPRLHHPELPPNHGLDVVLPARRAAVGRTEPLIIVGASTGGTEAIKDFLLALPARSPAVLITQHMPEMFTRSFAQRLDSLSVLSVHEARHGEKVQAGHVYIAPGHSHMMVRQVPGGYGVELSQAPPVNRHRPSVDVLFRSAANCAGSNAVGVILTGMGKDGAVGLLEMKQAGARTLAQDEASCVVFGMPKEAISLGAVDEVVSLAQMGSRVTSWVQQHASGRPGSSG